MISSWSAPGAGSPRRTADSRPSSRSSASIPVSPDLAERVAGGGDTVQIMLPNDEVDPACLDHCVLHMLLGGKARNRLPAHLRMLDVGGLVKLEELELGIAEAEERLPAMALHAEPADLLHEAGAVARHVDALGAGIGDDAF